MCGQGGLSGLHRSGKTFGGLGLQGKSDGSLASNIFKSSRTEEGMGAGKDIVEGGFRFAASEARKNFNITASAVQTDEDRSASPSTQEHQKLEGKLKHDLTGERSGSKCRE